VNAWKLFARCRDWAYVTADFLASGWVPRCFLTGVFPPVLAVTGFLMWWRRRRMSRQDSSVRDAGEEKLVAAE
jgi:uncharacterized iron-regulated membrane protein